MVVLDTGGGTFFMRLSDAVAAVQLLARAQRVDYQWSEKCYKFTNNDGRGEGISVKQLTLAQIAQLHLESDSE